MKPFFNLMKGRYKMINKDEVLARALKYNKSNGKTVTAINTVFATAYPAGTNLVVEFIKLMVGLPYGDDSMRLDESADCSQFVINTLYYWFGIDYLGSYTQSMYTAAQSHGKQYSTIADAPVLSVVLWKLSTRNKNATHTALKVSDTQIADTRSKSKPLMLRDYAGWYNSKITCVVDLLTDEQKASVTVESVAIPTISRVLKLKIKYMNGADVLAVQTKLKELGYFKGSLRGNYGPITTAAVKKFQKAKKLTVDGKVGKYTTAALGMIWNG